MNALFADAVYLMALVNPRDENYARAVAFDAKDRILVTTRYVIVELADGLSHPLYRQRAIDLIDALEKSRNIRIIPSDESLFREGYSLYCGRLDKGWSLTDCMSFVVMEREGITDALTADHHFEQAGFVAILK